MPGAAEGAHTRRADIPARCVTAASTSIVCHLVHFVAQGKHIFAGNAHLERVRLGANMPGAGMERRGGGKPSPGENT